MLRDEKPMAFVGISDRDRARAFYRDTLGLKLIHEDQFALVFALGGDIMLRVTPVSEVHAQPHTIFGWQVTDAGETARALAAAGVELSRYPGLEQDADGVWTAPGGAKIAWFKDPDGNTLSIAQM